MKIFPVFLGMRGCPTRCIYCDQDRISGAPDLDLNSLLPQIQDFIERNPAHHKQIAFYGGSFTALQQYYRENLLRLVLKLIDDQTSFRISTHPLFVDEDILDWCAAWNIKTIELGIQDFSDEVLRQSCRGYDGKQAWEAASRVKEKGFELGIQLMPGLPGWSQASLAENHARILELKANLLRLYPLIIIRGTALEKIFHSGEYTPLSLEEAVTQCANYFPIAEKANTRIIKLGIPSNINPEEIVAGPWHPAFGELVKAELVARKVLSINPQEEAVTLEREEIRLLKAHGGKALDKVQAWFEHNT